MERYDMTLRTFLKYHDEKSFDLFTRLQMAKKFWENVQKITSRNVFHRDLKPNNVVINVTGKAWNGQLEIIDYGIAAIGSRIGKKKGTSGWAQACQLIEGTGSDDFAIRLVIFMILLSWRKAWEFIWDPISVADSQRDKENTVEKLFMKCQNRNDIPILLKEIESRLDSGSFRDKWVLYCESASRNKDSCEDKTSNTKCTLNVGGLSNIHDNTQETITAGTQINDQGFSNLCHSFPIMASLRKELCNVMQGQTLKYQNHNIKTSLDLLSETKECSFSNLFIEFVFEISPRSLHGLAGQDWNQKELFSQFADVEKTIRRLVYKTRAFQKEGWKRISGVKEFFTYFELADTFEKNFELEYCKVSHINSLKNDHFNQTANFKIPPPKIESPHTTFNDVLPEHYIIERDF